MLQQKIKGCQENSAIFFLRLTKAEVKFQRFHEVEESRARAIEMKYDTSRQYHISTIRSVGRVRTSRSDSCGITGSYARCITWPISAHQQTTNTDTITLTEILTRIDLSSPLPPYSSVGKRKTLKNRVCSLILACTPVSSVC